MAIIIGTLLPDILIGTSEDDTINGFGGLDTISGGRIVYNAATGQLFYDADGSGAGAAVLLATLSGSVTLSASDFQVI